MHTLHYFILSISLTAALSARAAVKEPTVSASGNILYVHTPSDTRLLFGDPGFDSLDSYSISIPMREPISEKSTPEKGTSEKVTLSETDRDYLLTRANGLYFRKNYLEALTIVEQVVHHFPNSVRAWAMRGSLMHLVGNQDGAIQSWQKGLEIDPQHTEMKHALDSVQNSQKRIQK